MNTSILPRSLFIAYLVTQLATHMVNAAGADEPSPGLKESQTSPAGRPAYPLTTCLVSGEPLEGGDMGGPVDYIHQEAGKPDRLVRFCCSGCIKKFKKEPAKYLAKLDAAAATATGKTAPAAPAKPADGHTSHAH